MASISHIGVDYPGDAQAAVQSAHIASNSPMQSAVLYHNSQIAENTESTYATASSAGGAQPQVIILTPSKDKPFTFSTSKQKTIIGLGVTIIILGLLSFILNVIICIAGGYYVSSAVPGIWCGIPTIGTGAFAIQSGKKKSKPLLIIFLTMAIITAILSFVFFVPMASISISISINEYGAPGIIAACALLPASGLAGGILSIVGSGFSCGMLCCRRSKNVNVQYVTLSGGVQPQVVTAHEQPVIMAAGVSYPSHQNLSMYSAQQAAGTSGTNDAADVDVTKHQLAARDAEQGQNTVNMRNSLPPPYSPARDGSKVPQSAAAQWPSTCI